MKKLIALVLSLIMAASLVACGGDTQDSAADTAAIQDTGRTTFNIGFDAEYPPFGYMDDNGGYVGFDIEVAQAVADMYGWELIKTPIDWDNKDGELNAETIDCIWSGFTINGREDLYEWTVPYCDNSQVIVVKSDAGIADLAGLAGKVVAVQAASAALDVLEDPEGKKDVADTFAELKQYPDYNTAFLDLEAGAVDAVAMDVGVANYQIKTREGAYTILEEALSTEQYGVGFKLGNKELCKLVSDALLALAKDGTIAKVAEKYEISDMICIE